MIRSDPPISPGSLAPPKIPKSLTSKLGSVSLKPVGTSRPHTFKVDKERLEVYFRSARANLSLMAQTFFSAKSLLGAKGNRSCRPCEDWDYEGGISPSPGRKDLPEFSVGM